jgi:hypothetical protein
LGGFAQHNILKAALKGISLVGNENPLESKFFAMELSDGNLKKVRSVQQFPEIERRVLKKAQVKKSIKTSRTKADWPSIYKKTYWV